MSVKRILFLTDDQHRWDAFSHHHWGSVSTPTVDRLAREGTTYTQAVATCPICVPNRFTWCHGLQPSQVAASLMNNAADWPMLPSLPGALQQHGFRTALIGKLHSFHGDFGSPEHQADTHARGFDDVVEVGGRSLTYRYDCNWTRHLAEHGLLDRYRQDLEDRNAHLCWAEPYRAGVVPYEHSMDVFIRHQIVDWIEQMDEGQPWFLHASFCGPHFPIDPPEGWFGRNKPADMPAPLGESDDDKVRYWQELRAAYADLTELVDHELGLVLDALDQRGWLDDTLIIHCSDHGDRLGDSGKWNKGGAEDGSVRTPWFVRLPGKVPAGVVHNDMVESVDVAATVLAAAGIDTPVTDLIPTSPSRSWWGHVTGQGPAPREVAYAEGGSWRMIADSEWKYVLFPDNGEEQLFRRPDDPCDLTNCIDTAAGKAVVDRYRRELLLRLGQTKAADTLATLERKRQHGPARKKLREAAVPREQKPSTSW